MTDTTILSLSGIGIPPYSVRGVQQVLEPIDAAAGLERTVNGELVDISVSELRKYRSTITCTDQQAPAVAAMWPGKLLTVDCISELALATEFLPTGEDPQDVIDRDIVPGSLREEGAFWFYRPRLTMRMVGFTVDTDEWGAAVGWTLELEEV